MNEHFIVVFSLDIYPYLKQKAFQFMTYELYRRDPPPPNLSPRASPYRETQVYSGLPERPEIVRLPPPPPPPPTHPPQKKSGTIKKKKGLFIFLT